MKYKLLYIPNGQVLILDYPFEDVFAALNVQNGRYFLAWKRELNLPTDTMFSTEEFEIIYE